MAKKFTRRYSTAAAIALHAEANKSDPFASRRIAMQIARGGFKEAHEVGKESQRILDARDVAIKKAYAEWLKSEQRAAIVGRQHPLAVAA
jgi:hypothetical protein